MKPLSMFSALVFTFFISLATTASAQMQAEGPMQMEKAQKVAQVLNLSPQQESQLQPILEKEAPKVKEIMQDPNLSAKEKKKKLKTVHSQTDPLVKSILTPPQYSQWETIRNDELEQLK
jgi:Skp family chaperone for outer membrane proteins